MPHEGAILLVEDDPTAVHLALHAFTKSGFPRKWIIVAKDGREAMDILFGSGKDPKERSGILPRLVLLDLKLPGVDGMEVLRAIRKEDRTRGLPVIILTNSDAEKDVVEGYNLGVNSYLRKPIDFDQLADTLKSLGLWSA